MERTTTPKRTAPPRGGEYQPGIFHHVTSVSDFAEALGVEERTINLIVPTNEACNKEDCPFNAIEANRGFCALHCQIWYPKTGGRGGAMYGPSFLRHNNANYKRCYCDLPKCHAAGYFPSQGAVKIPLGMRPTVFSAGALFTDEKLNEYINNPSKDMQLYLWHFLPEHLVKTDDNKWALPKYDTTKRYRDRENKYHNFPPPIMNPESFIEEQLSTYVPRQERWAEENPTSKMPMWMLNMLDIDEELYDAGPSPLKKMMNEQANNIRSLQMKLELLRARAKYHSERAEALQQSSRDKLNAAEERRREEMSAVKKQYEDKLKKKDEEIGKANAVIKEQEEEIAKLKVKMTLTDKI